MPDPQANDFLSAVIQSASVTPWGPAAESRLDDVAQQVADAMANPVEFPALPEAMVPGDHVVLAIDPSVPQLDQVVEGVIRSMGQAGQGRIDAVLWDEASEQAVDQVRSVLPPTAQVVRHQAGRRRDVRYLGANQQGDPIYLNRLLVDADLVIPITVERPTIENWETLPADSTGIFPMLADSASRRRYQGFTSDQRLALSTNPVDASSNAHPAWLLGVQMMLRVSTNRYGQVSAVTAGTISALERTRQTVEPPNQVYDLIVLDLRESCVAQSWHNVARSVHAITTWANQQATLVLWTDLDQPLHHPGGRNGQLLDSDDDEIEMLDPTETDDEDFPSWNVDGLPQTLLGHWMSQYRLVLRSQLESETAELGEFGVIEAVNELGRLSASFGECLLVHCGHLYADLVPAIEIASNRN